MERIQADGRVLASELDHVADPLLGVAGDEADLSATLASEQGEEPLEGLLVVALGSPHQPAAVVVDDDGQVPAALVGDLVNADPAQPVERVDPSAGLVTTRATIAPTVAQAMRNSGVIAVSEVCTASQATVSSKARVWPAASTQPPTDESGEPPFMRGHPSATQRAIASSSRSTARRAGRWRVQPNLSRNNFHTRRRDPVDRRRRCSESNLQQAACCRSSRPRPRRSRAPVRHRRRPRHRPL